MKHPVTFIIFNRPDTAARVFETIRAYRPPQLLVIADGPRPGRAGEAERCRAARALIDTVDWPCEVLRNFSDQNLGCKARVASGLDWVFRTVPDSMILEDDCLPRPTFFPFCEQMLEHYRDDERVMCVSGTNLCRGLYQPPHGYFFSRYAWIWGWASWRRAWAHYDVAMRQWPALRDAGLLDTVFEDQPGRRYYSNVFDATYRGQVDTWDYQWQFACWAQHGLTAMAGLNQVTNIGFRPDATHTRGPEAVTANLPSADLSFPIDPPPYVARDARADALIQRTILTPPFWERARRKFSRLVGPRPGPPTVPTA